MKKKALSLVLASAFALSLLTGCGNKAKDTDTKEQTTITTEADTEVQTSTQPIKQEGTEATDRAGNTIYLPEKIDKIVSMSPATTRFLIDLGLGSKIIAIDTNSADYIDKLSSDVKQFDMMAPDNEALVQLDPDIIFTSGMSNSGGEDVYQPARDAGICVADIPSSASFEDIVKDLEFIGTAVGEKDKTAKIIDEFNSKLDEIKKIGETITDKKKVLFELSIPSAEYPSLYTFGSGTYLDEMITTIGAENVTGDQNSWVSISEEEAIAMNPDVIITNVTYVDNVTDVIKSAAGWENVTAIQNDAVYFIDSNSSNQPNQHVLDAMIQMAKQIYPDEYKSLKDPFASATDAISSSGDATASTGDAE
ncbi:MAG: ABC transporter substrate-binding protein [Eubacterium sp.]|nr:ABC transporter substrate-binding protein [Eubacterium sp.]